MKEKCYVRRTESVVRLSKGLGKNTTTVLGPMTDPDPKVIVDPWKDSGGCYSTGVVGVVLVMTCVKGNPGEQYSLSSLLNLRLLYTHSRDRELDQNPSTNFKTFKDKRVDILPLLCYYVTLLNTLCKHYYTITGGF